MPIVIILGSLLCNCRVVDSFLSFVFEWLPILSVSLLFLFNRWLFLLIAGWKLKNSLTKWQSPLRIPETNHSFWENWQDSCLSSEYLIRFFPVLFVHLSLMLSSKVPLRPSDSLPPPSNFFIHSLSLHPFCPRHNSRRRPLFMWVLSYSSTQHLNRHMAWCGCHEILIERCIIVLFVSNFEAILSHELIFKMLNIGHNLVLRFSQAFRD